MAATNFEIVVPLTDALSALHLIRRLAEGEGETLGMRRRLGHIADVARDTLDRCKGSKGHGSRQPDDDDRGR